MESRLVDGYILPPRLAGARGQLMQGDVFKDVPFVRIESEDRATPESGWAILLTPTCDFALKDEHPERQVAPIEPLGANDGRKDRWKTSIPPRHLLLLPPLLDHLPDGGIVHFRRAQQLHARDLQPSSRVATINEPSLRRLLAAHTSYYTRAAIDSATIPIAVDDPRVLWRMVDEIEAVSALATKRTALERALRTAIEAVARHHGISAPSPAMALVWLEELTKKKVLPVTTRKVVRTLTATQRALLELFRVIPAELSNHKATYQHLVEQLEHVGTVLQETDPEQLTPDSLRAAGLTNLIRS